MWPGRGGGMEWPRGRGGGTEWPPGRGGGMEWPHGRGGGMEWPPGRGGGMEWSPGRGGGMEWPHGRGGGMEWPHGRGGGMVWPHGLGGGMEWPHGRGGGMEWPHGLGGGMEWPHGRGAVMEWPHGRGRGRGSEILGDMTLDLVSIDNMFNAYAELDVHDAMGPRGITSLFHALNVAERETILLSLAWKMEATRLGYFTREEWRRGLFAMHADSLLRLSMAVQKLFWEATGPNNIESFHRYAFRYYLTVNMENQLNNRNACGLLKIILSGMYPGRVQEFTEYLMHFQIEYPFLTSHQWMEFLRFCREVEFPSLDNYACKAPWSPILDGFASWIVRRQLPRVPSHLSSKFIEGRTL